MKPRQGWHQSDALVMLALLLSISTWGGWGIWLDGYVPLSHPFALPGARGLPGAGVFNALVFVLPGGLMAVLADRLRRELPPSARRWRRIGCALAMLAAVGWIGQGLMPLDLEHLDAGSSRWHALAWTLWSMAAASSALLMTLLVPELRRWSVALLVVLVLPWVWPGVALAAGLTQSAAMLVWGGWIRAGLRQPFVPATAAPTRRAAARRR